MKKAEAYWPLILLLAIVKFVLPLFLHSPVYELHRDEYLYYAQGQHPALGFLENPPLLSLMATISSWFGGSESWVRLWPCLFGAATVVVTCLLVAELGGKLFAQFLAALGIMTGSFLRIHFLFQPNFLDIFFWTLAVYFLIRYINTRNIHFIYSVSLALALGWWGKYSVLFMVVAILAGLVLTKHRNVFLKRQTWMAILIGLAIALPNIIWQYLHNWPLLHHMNELQSTQLKYMDAPGFIKDQLLMLLPVSFVWIIGLVWLFRHREYRIVGYIYFIIVLLLVLGKGKSYYALGAYPMLLAAGGVAIERFTAHRYWLRYAIAIVVIVLGTILIPILLPVWKPERLAAAYERRHLGKMGMLKWEDHKTHALSQDFADMLGWKQLTEKTERFYQSLDDSSRSNTIIYCGNYGQAGALKYYGKDKAFKDRVITANGSFLLWIPAELHFNNLLLVDDDPPPKDDEIYSWFRSVSPVDSVQDPYSRQNGNQIIYMQGVSNTGEQMMRGHIDKLKKQFTR
jgi:4-amino-4-deoxy-L-arabinose transferase-like glycosyltransferase